MKPWLSIIVPVFNEEKTIGNSLRGLSLADEVEVIVVDGGSTDRTVEIARTFPVKVIPSEKGRAVQMNRGAEVAVGEVLLFLHADCKLPSGAFALIKDTLWSGHFIAGAFDIQIDAKGIFYRLVERAANLRSRLLGLIYGDQAMFLKRKTFFEVGGFPELPLMEDIAISKKLRRLGRIRFLRPPVVVSARRWQKEGRFYTTVRDIALATAYIVFNVSPSKLVRFYRDVR